MPVIAHLSDTHVDGSGARSRRFVAVLEQLADLAAIDAVVVSGDLTDHGTSEEYAQFFSALAGTAPALVVLGNHDLSEPAATALREAGRDPAPNTFTDIDGLRIVGLDSHLDGQDEGVLGGAALAFAREAIATTPGPLILVLHHPPISIGHDVMDNLALQNPDALEDLIRHSNQVIGVLTGHVHTALATTFAGVPLLGAPGIVSTMRLGSKTDPIADEGAMPGFALHTIDDAVFRTVFHYLSPADL